MFVPLKTTHLALVALGAVLPFAAIAAPVDMGMTTVTFNPDTLSTLTSAGFSLAPVAPATLATEPVISASFPIVGGDTSSIIDHSGGLALTRSGTTADLQNFAINVTNNTLLGQVIVGSTTLNNVTLFDLSMTNGATNLALSNQLSGAIDQVFGVNLPAGTPIGTAVVTPTPEPASFGLAGFSLLAGFALWRKRRTV